jgi:lysophospholipase L1-like esterase
MGCLLAGIIEVRSRSFRLEDSRRSERNIVGDAVSGQTKSRSFKRNVLFRVGAIAVGLLPFLILEFVLQFSGWNDVDAAQDPFIGFTEIRPLFEPDNTQTDYEISKARLPLFQPDSFLINKPEDEFRIFCIGGSTVQGRPFSIETAFSKWMELNLNTTDKSRRWKVINCGGVSYASYRLIPIVEEVLNYEPDLIVLYTGHNEFLEDRTYESIKATPAWITRTHERLSQLKTYSFLRSCIVSQPASSNDSSAKNTLPTEVEARLDFKNGLDQYTRDDDWKQSVAKHFEANLRRMVSSIRKANVPLIVCNPTCDLRNSPPFKSENSAELTKTQLDRFKELQSTFAGQGSAQERSLTTDIKTLTAMLEIDDRHARTHFELATALLANGDPEKAAGHFFRAKEEDICPLRAIEPIYESIASVSSDLNLNFVDVRSSFEDRSADGITGRETLIDHVHPTIHGHQLIAQMLIDEMRRTGFVESNGNENLNAEVAKQFDTHLESLPFMYFQRGKDRLAGLKRWAAGEVTRERINESSEQTEEAVGQ